MKRRKKYIFGYLLVLAVIALMNTSCSRNFKRANLTESLRYLQSATLNEELSTNYGYSESIKNSYQGLPKSNNKV